MAFRLAELFVEIGLRGAVAFGQGLANIHNQLKAIETGARAVGTAATRAFTVASAALTGWVTAGLAGTAQGNLLTLQIQLLSREIASVFLPYIDAATEGIARLVGWFRQLSGAQQANIRHWIEGAAAGTAVAIILPRVIGLLAGVVAGVAQLTAAMVGLNVSTGGVLYAIGAIVTAVSSLGVGLFVASGGAGSLARDLTPAFKELMKVLGEVYELMRPVFEELRKAGQVIIVALADSFRQLLPEIKALAKELGPLLVLLVRLTAVALVTGIQNLTNVLKALLPVATTLAGALAALGKSLTTGLPELPAVPAVAEEDERRRDVIPAGSQFEAVTQSFRRIQQASLNLEVGVKDPAVQTAANTATALEKLDEIIMGIGHLQPAFTA